MEPLLTDDQVQVQAAAAKLMGEMGGASRMRAMRADASKLDQAAWRAVCEAQWPLLLVPTSADGHGLGATELALVAEPAGEHLLHVPLVEATVGLDLQARFTGRLPDGPGTDPALVLPVWLDPEDSYNAGDQWPVATLGGDGLRFAGGTVRLARGSHERALYVLPAWLDGEAALLSLDAREHADRIQAGHGIDGVRSDALNLDGLVLPPTAVLGRGDAARAAYERAGELLRIGTSAALAGVAASAHRLTLDHLRTRRQFGRALSTFQALQHRCVDALIDLELNRSLLFRVAQGWDLGQTSAPMVAALKARTSRAALSITRLALQMHGAAGYADQHDIGLFHRRALCLAAAYGSEAHQVARFSRATWADREAA
jgi:alkylation response protein AidB-like acyl-CoA dehydrogenase